MELIISNHCVHRYIKRLLKKNIAKHIKKYGIKRIKNKLEIRIKDGSKDIIRKRKHYLKHWLDNAKTGEDKTNFIVNESTIFVGREIGKDKLIVMTCYNKEKKIQKKNCKEKRLKFEKDEEDFLF